MRVAPPDLPGAQTTDSPIDRALALLLANETEAALRWAAATVERDAVDAERAGHHVPAARADGPHRGRDRGLRARRAPRHRRREPPARGRRHRRSARARGRRAPTTSTRSRAPSAWAPTGSPRPRRRRRRCPTSRASSRSAPFSPGPALTSKATQIIHAAKREYDEAAGSELPAHRAAAPLQRDAEGGPARSRRRLRDDHRPRRPLRHRGRAKRARRRTSSRAASSRCCAVRATKTTSRPSCSRASSAARCSARWRSSRARPARPASWRRVRRSCSSPSATRSRPSPRAGPRSAWSSRRTAAAAWWPTSGAPRRCSSPFRRKSGRCSSSASRRASSRRARSSSRRARRRRGCTWSRRAGRGGRARRRRVGRPRVAVPGRDRGRGGARAAAQGQRRRHRGAPDGDAVSSARGVHLAHPGPPRRPPRALHDRGAQGRRDRASRSTTLPPPSPTTTCSCDELMMARPDAANESHPAPGHGHDPHHDHAHDDGHHGHGGPPDGRTAPTSDLRSASLPKKPARRGASAWSSRSSSRSSCRARAARSSPAASSSRPTRSTC